MDTILAAPSILSGTVFLNNSTISGNTGAEALETFVGHIILNNSTVVGNSGGIDNNQGTVSLRNSILSGNPTTGTPANCTGSIGSAGYNLIGIKNSGCTFTAGTGDKVGTVALPLDPKLGPLADNGGPTFTHALTSGSPAIGAGNPADPGSGAAACLATDQRGTPRLPLPEGGCDMGAYELPAAVRNIHYPCGPQSIRRSYCQLSGYFLGRTSPELILLSRSVTSA